MSELTDRELATVLAALRFWQDEMGPHPHASGCYPEHFDGIEPLDAQEIDDLCDRLNTTQGVMHGS
jgi:hypothetical protein